MVIDVINTTNKNLKKYNPQSIEDIYQQDRMIVDLSDNISIARSAFTAVNTVCLDCSSIFFKKYLHCLTGLI